MAPRLSRDTIEASLRGAFGRPCRFFDAIDSTNYEALRWAAEGAPEGAIVVAEHQTAGRGRRGRTWVDRPGSSLLFSLVLRPAMRFERLGLLSAALGIGCAQGIESLTGIAARTKWPNDITVDGRKVAGILVETRLVGPEVDVAVAGIGINFDWDLSELPPDIARTATSISLEAQRVDSALPVKTELLASVLSAIEEVYPLVARSTEELLRRARERSEILGRRVVVRYAGGEAVEGTAVDVAADGGLELDLDGDSVRVHVGEIEHVRPAPR